MTRARLQGSPQPRWAIAALGVVAAGAALAYAWGANREVIEIYYGAAVRSMSSSWHDFAFGAFDPAGTVTLDKLPGAFWLQALSARIFGLHVWSIVLPQVVEGVLTIVVIYRVVRRQAGWAAGLLAAGLLAAAPAAVALDRGNISDSLLILLLVLAADATARATETGRPATLVLAGVWVGLAFQAKMLEAWLVLPALGASYLLAAPGNVGRRIAHVAAGATATVAVSLAWMCVVALTPAHDRPYVDGSTHDSIFQQVFHYNGFGRIDTPLAGGVVGRAAATLLADFGIRHERGWDRLVVGAAGRDVAWLLPAAAVSLVALLWARRREPRTDRVRAAAVLWGVWLVVLFVAFSTADRINAYYLAALAPPLAALVAIGAAAAWQARSPVPVAVLGACSAAYAIALLPTGRLSLVLPLVLGVLGTAALAAGVLAALRRGVHAEAAAFGLALVALVAAPAVASGAIVVHRLGPFDTPFQPSGITAVTQTFAGQAQHPSPSLVATFERAGRGAAYPLATYTSLIAAPLIFATGKEVLPIGGFDGMLPSPTLSRLQQLIASGRLHLIASPPTRDPRIRWIRRHCLRLPAAVAFPVSYCR